MTEYNIDYKIDQSIFKKDESLPSISVDALSPFNIINSTVFDGDKFPGGFGDTNLYVTDYWTLRARSAQLFKENLYARGLLRRLVTNEINVGLFPESNPDTKILKEKQDLTDWTELVEARFEAWADNPEICDYYQAATFGQIQQSARLEALVSGDVLVVLTQSSRTKMPTVRLVSGDKIRTPLSEPRSGNTVKHGVELDAQGRMVAFWVMQEDLTSKRIPAYGEKSGRRIAWLVYGSDKRIGEVRGEPLLSIVLQSLKELDRYRDAALRKAVVNSILAMFIKKTQDKPGTLPLTGGAVRRTNIGSGIDTPTQRSYNIERQVAGVVMQELQVGEEPVGFNSQGTDINFPAFEASIIHAIAWANEVPPEVLTLAFQNNYSASQAAINEFKQYINKIWVVFGQNFCTPIYKEWLVSEALLGKISADGLLESWGKPEQYDIFGAWSRVLWYGSIKPTTDMLKATRGAQVLVQEGWSTNAHQARSLTGTKFSDNIAWLERENVLKAKAMRPFLELSKEFGIPLEKIQALMQQNEVSMIKGADVDD